MTSFFFEPRLQVPVRHKVFVSYHHDNDQGAYNAFSQAFHDKYEVIRDTSLDRTIGSEDPEYVIRRIREDYIRGSSCTIVLVGAQTPGRKYIDWEIKATLDKEHGLIGVHLPSAGRDVTGAVLVPDRLYDNIQSGFALFVSWENLTSSAVNLEAYVADAKARDRKLIVNNRVLRTRNS